MLAGRGENPGDQTFIGRRTEIFQWHWVNFQVALGRGTGGKNAWMAMRCEFPLVKYRPRVVGRGQGVLLEYSIRCLPAISTQGISKEILPDDPKVPGGRVENYCSHPQRVGRGNSGNRGTRMNRGQRVADIGNGVVRMASQAT